jgi:hypothetical protein
VRDGKNASGLFDALQVTQRLPFRLMMFLDDAYRSALLLNVTDCAEELTAAKRAPSDLWAHALDD